MKKWIALVLLTVLLGGSLINSSPRHAQGQEDAPVSVAAYDLEATVAKDWMMMTYTLVRDNKLGPTEGSRVYGYMGIAAYESVSPGMPSNYYSLGGTIQDMPIMPYPDPDPFSVSYDWISSMNATMPTVLKGLFPDATPEMLAAIDELRARYEVERTEAVGADVVERSLAFGDAVGTTLIEWIANDNYGPVKKLQDEYVIPTGEDYLWSLTTEGTKANGSHWGELRTIGLPYPEACDISMRMEYSTDPDSVFYKQAQEVMNVGANLTEWQQETARFWLDAPAQTGTPSGHWVMIEIQLIDQMELSLGRTAEMFVLTNSALMDAFIGTWSLKYRVNLMRPVTYIQANLRRNWNPYVETPPFPEYPSGHSTASSAAATILTQMFGQVAFVDRTPIINGHEQIEREYTSFFAAANEAAISRLYGGIHFRAAIENGQQMGQCIGDYTLNNVRIRSVPQGE